MLTKVTARAKDWPGGLTPTTERTPMLPSLTLLGKIKRQGIDAAYHGTTRENCPYSTLDLKDAWLRGWAIGSRSRTDDMARGTHPDIEHKGRHNGKRS